jgi:hypothetical protein
MTWNEILSQVRDLDTRFRAEGSGAWYRGERCASWQLTSTVHRYIERLTKAMTTPPPDDDRVQLLKSSYKTLYRRFKAEAWPLLGDRERSDWGVLFAMQHFSIPTRLLDWTESFACAVFFAQLRRRRADSAAIWVLDPQALNHLSIGREDLVALDEDTSNAPPKDSAGTRIIDSRAWHPKWASPDNLPTIAVAPIFTNARMVSQRSAFTLSGDSFEPLDRQHPKLADDGRLVKLVLLPETFDDAEEYLLTAGLSAFSFYPDLQGLALKHEQRVERTIRDAKKAYPGSFQDSPETR